MLPMISGIVSAVMGTTFAGLDVPTTVLGKVRLVGEYLIDCPVPSRSTGIGLRASLFCSDRPPYNVPVTVGLKVRVIVQLPLPLTTEPQLLRSQNGPQTWMLSHVSCVLR